MFSVAGGTPLGFLALKWIYFHFVFSSEISAECGGKEKKTFLKIQPEDISSRACMANLALSLCFYLNKLLIKAFWDH